MTLTLDAATDTLQLLAEPSRVRLLSLLARDELTVAELVEVTGLGQSTVSTHLGKLREAGLVRDRRAGSSTHYALDERGMSPSAGAVWKLLARDVADPRLEADRKQCAAVIAARTAPGGWPDPLAGEMDRHYSPGRTWESMANGLAGLLELGDVLDAGAGDGAVAELLAPRARTITCVDKSPAMVGAARARLRDVAHARVREGDVEALPFDDGAFDQVLLFHVLVHVARPERALAEVARVLRPKGTLAVLTLDAHEDDAFIAPYGHVHRGFSPATLTKMLARAGLEPTRAQVVCQERRAPQFRVVFARAKALGAKGDRP